MEFLTSSDESTGAGAQACEICKDGAVTRVPVRSLKPQTVRRYIFGRQREGRDKDALVALCGVCTLLHCEETFEGDGPVRFLPSERMNDRVFPEPTDAFDRAYEPSRAKRASEFDYAAALLRVLERGGYHIYLRSDGRQIILSHQDGLDRQTRGQVERYRREITEVIIERLWQGQEGQ